MKLIELFYEHFECSVILPDGLSEGFEVRTGVRQGCILSPLLFLILIDFVLRQSTRIPRGIQWTLQSRLEDLDFADDLALLSYSEQHMQQKTNALAEEARKVGLLINTAKTKVMCINTVLTSPITIGDVQLENIDEFTYLGSIISKEDSVRPDITSRLNKSKSVFARLRPIWRSQVYSRRMKLHLYNSMVKTVLLYGSESWRITESDRQRLDVFHNSALRKICRIFWPEKITNEALYDITNSEPMGQIVKKRRLRWFGHVSRMDIGRIPHVSLNWTPIGKRKKGRPKATWRSTVVNELKEMGLTWGEAKCAANDRDGWRMRVEASCSTRS